MSWQALEWALKHTPKMKPSERLVLAVLASHADGDGRTAYPSQKTIAGDLQCNIKTVGDAMKRLRALGLIQRGDQSKAHHIPSYARPVVYDMVMTNTRSSIRDVDPPVDNHPPVKDHPPVKTAVPPGDSPATPWSFLPDPLVPAPDKPSYEPPCEPPFEPPVRPATDVRASDRMTPPRIDAIGLIKEHVTPLPPKAVMNGLAHQVRTLIDENVERQLISAALTEWSKRAGVGPGLLPHIVSDIQRAATGARPTKYNRPLTRAEQNREWVARRLAEIDAENANKTPELDDRLFQQPLAIEAGA